MSEVRGRKSRRSEEQKIGRARRSEEQKIGRVRRSEEQKIGHSTSAFFRHQTLVINMISVIKRRQILAGRLLEDPHLKEYLEAGLIDELVIRNCSIINDYVILRKKYKYLDTLEMLAEKYFLSTNRIHNILYCKK